MKNINQGLSTNYILKTHIEKMLGEKHFLLIKDYPLTKTWKKTIILMMNSYKKAIEQSIKVAPSFFYDETNNIFKHYLEIVKKCNNSEELFSSVVAFQSELLFSFLGNYSISEKRSLSSSWDLSKYRETQIVQNKTHQYNQIKDSVLKSFTRDQIDKMINEKLRLNNKDDLYIWIYKNKMG